MVNKVILIGNLGADPEIRYTQSGTAVATLRLATTERFKGKDGQMQDQTEWHRVIAWSRLAEICGEYLHKGSKVYIEGRLQTRKWTDQNGNEKYTTEIIAREMKMLSPRAAARSRSPMAAIRIPRSRNLHRGWWAPVRTCRSRVCPAPGKNTGFHRVEGRPAVPGKPFSCRTGLDLLSEHSYCHDKKGMPENLLFFPFK